MCCSGQIGTDADWKSEGDGNAGKYDIWFIGETIGVCCTDVDELVAG